MSLSTHRYHVSPWLLLVFLVPIAAAAVDVSGTYTGTAQANNGSTTSLALTLTQQGTNVTGTLQVINNQCFSSLSFLVTLNGTALSGAFTDSTNRIDVHTHLTTTLLCWGL